MRHFQQYGFLSPGNSSLEFIHDLLQARCSSPCCFGNFSDDIRHLCARQFEAVEGAHDKGCPADLAVDTHDGPVPPPISKVTIKVWNLVLSVLPREGPVCSLVDGILMGTGKCGRTPALLLLGYKAPMNIHLGVRHRLHLRIFSMLLRVDTPENTLGRATVSSVHITGVLPACR